MNLQSGYLVGGLIIGVVFALMYLIRKDLRREMVFGGLLATPYALTASFFIPEYWNPLYFLGANSFGAGLEDFIFCFFVGGIAAVIYELVASKRVVKLKSTIHKGWLPYILGTIIFLSLEFIFPSWSILSLIGSLLMVVLLVIKNRPDLFKQAFIAGISFSALYYVLFTIFAYIYPTFIEQIYHHQNLLGIYIFSIPLEEILFAFSIGSSWSVSYEYILGYKS